MRGNIEILQFEEHKHKKERDQRNPTSPEHSKKCKKTLGTHTSLFQNLSQNINTYITTGLMPMELHSEFTYKPSNIQSSNL